MLTDLYTPTTDPSQYLGYIRTLIHAVSANDSMRFKWQKTLKRPSALALVKALRKEIGGETGWSALTEGEKKMRADAKHMEWLDAAHAVATDSDSPEAFVRNDEIGLSGFLEANKLLLPEGLYEPTNHAHATHAIDVFRRFDIRTAGYISADDLAAVLMEDAASDWLPRQRKSTFTRVAQQVKQTGQFLKELSEHSKSPGKRGQGAVKSKESKGGKMRQAGKLAMLVGSK